MKFQALPIVLQILHTTHQILHSALKPFAHKTTDPGDDDPSRTVAKPSDTATI